MLVPRVVAITYFSGRKGGTGKSTIAANQAIALSMALKTNTVLIDFGIDSTQTVKPTTRHQPRKTRCTGFHAWFGQGCEPGSC